MGPQHLTKRTRRPAACASGLGQGTKSLRDSPLTRGGCHKHDRDRVTNNWERCVAFLLDAVEFVEVCKKDSPQMYLTTNREARRAEVAKSHLLATSTHT
jgi:hypothetical protein